MDTIIPSSEYDFALAQTNRSANRTYNRTISNGLAYNSGLNFNSWSADAQNRFLNSNKNIFDNSSFLAGLSQSNENKIQDLLQGNNTANAWIGGTNAALQGISTIGGLVMSIKNYQMQKDALNKQKELIDEQINASKENRAQRRAEITRMNKVRSNTNKMFNNSAVVSRSY